LHFSEKKSIFIALITLLIAGYLPCYSGEISFFKNTEYALVPDEENLLQSSSFRPVIDLCGRWEYRIEGEEDWNPVEIPSCYSSSKTLYFRRSFQIDSTYVRKQIKLVALGIQYRCLIRINGILVGIHAGGYTSFSFNISSGTLNFNRENHIEIVVFNRLNPYNTIPLLPSIWGWRNYGGIFREIFLTVYPKASIASIAPAYNFSQDYLSCKITNRILIQNAPSTIIPEGDSEEENIVNLGVSVQLRKFEDGSIVSQSPVSFIQIHRHGTVTIELNVSSPLLWSPLKPNRYRLVAELFEGGRQIDEYAVTIGLRDLTIRDGTIYLNNNPLQLNGIFYHEDYPGLASAVNWKALEHDIIIMKNLGVNFVQGGLYPCHPYFYQLCDKYGLLTTETIPLWQVPALSLNRQDFINLAHTQLREMIQRDRLHPSIIAWGLGNGIQASHPATGNFLLNISASARELDTRPLYSLFLESKSVPDVEDIDIIMVGFPTGVIETGSENILSWIKSYPKKPVIIGKYGCYIFPESYTGYANRTSAEYQGKFIKEALQTFAQINGLDGSIIWSYADWYGERPLLTNNLETDSYLYAMGLVDYQRHERVGYKMANSLLTGTAPPSLFMGDYNEKNPNIYLIFGFLIILCIIASSRLSHRFNENIRRSLLFTRGFFTDVGMNRFVSMGQTFYLGLFIALILAMILSSFLYYFRNSIFFDYALSHFLPWNTLKEIVIYFTWNNSLGIIFGTVIWMFGFLVLGLLLYVLSIFIPASFSVRQAVQVTYWSGAIFIYLIPIGMILYPALSYYQWTLLLFIIIGIIFFIWFFSRVITGLSLILRVSFQKIAFLVIGVLGLIFIVYVVIFNYNFATREYLNWYWTMLLNS